MTERDSGRDLIQRAIAKGTQLNATYLFECPYPESHNSEQWWTALLSMLVLHVAGQPNGTTPIWQYRREGRQWWFSRTDRTLNCRGLSFSHVLVEVDVTKAIPHVDWPSEFKSRVPDLTIVQGSRNVTLIENKTTRAGANQLESNLKAAEHLRNHGCGASLFLLTSVGNHQPDVWSLILKHRIDLILWEDVLRRIHSVPHFRALFDRPLLPFYENPAMSGEDS